MWVGGASRASSQQGTSTSFWGLSKGRRSPPPFACSLLVQGGYDWSMCIIREVAADNVKRVVAIRNALANSVDVAQGPDQDGQ